MLDLVTLTKLEEKISKIATAYVDIIHNSSVVPQIHVIRQLIKASHILLILTPKVYDSPWVKFELILAKLLNKKIIKVSYDDLIATDDVASFFCIGG